MLASYATFGIAASQGYLGIVSPTLQDLIGRPCTTVRELILDPARRGAGVTV